MELPESILETEVCHSGIRPSIQRRLLHKWQ